MNNYIDPHFIRALCCDPDKRTLQELQIIYYGLHGLDATASYRDSVLRALCKFVRYEKYTANAVLFCTGELSTCWYILLSGAVFINGSMFLPGSSFGKRNGGSVRRPSECFVLETSEMIVIDYPETTNSSSINPSSIYHRTPSLIPNTNCSATQSSPFTYGGNNQLVNSASGGGGSVGGIIVAGSGGVVASGQATVIPGGVGGGVGGNSCSNNHHHHHHQQQQQQQQQQHQSQSQVPYHHHHHQGPASATTTPTANFRSILPYRHQSIGSSIASGIAGATYGSGNGSLMSTMDHHHNLRHGSGVNIVFEDSNFGSNRPELYQKCNRGSHSSDTSSAYSGSDTMTSVHSSSLDVDEVDLSGLVESVVDSDEEDLAESMDSLAVRDTVRECLEKDPSDRTEDDIETLLDFTKNLKAFTNMTLAVRRALCSVMVFAVVEKAGTMVMNNGEELDSWSVLINGHVEIEHGHGEKEELQVGDSFGILPTMVKLYHRGVMRTKCHDCQFVCITQTDYYRIHHQGEENTLKHEENGHLVMVTELRHGGMDGSGGGGGGGSNAASGVGNAVGGSLSGCGRRGHVVIRGTPERLMLQLIEENSMTDPTYVEDFLLTHRTFIGNAQDVSKQLLTWFETTEPLQSTTATPSEIRDRVTRVVLLWVNNHFTDFETDPQMMEFLETFEAGLEKKFMQGHLRLLHIACAAKARTRTITLARSSRDEDLHFTIIGGYEKGGYGIFISKVDKKSKPEDRGLKRGDQILEVNGQSFEHVSHARAIELLMGTTHLSITVKSNLLAFKEMIQNSDSNSPRSRQGRRKAMSDIAKLQTGVDPRVRLSSVDLLGHDQTDCLMLAGFGGGGTASPQSKYGTGSKRDNGATAASTTTTTATTTTTTTTSTTTNSAQSSASNQSHNKGGFMTLGPKRRLQKALIKMNLLPKNAVTLLMDGLMNHTDDMAPAAGGLNATLSGSSGNVGSAGNASTTGSICSTSSGSSTTNIPPTTLYQSHSNPDLTTVYYEDSRASDYPEHVLKVYKSDQTCKYLLVHKETTAHEVVMLALQEFGIHETSSNFSLCEVSVGGDGGMIKQRRLPDQLQNLAERIGLAARYYLKTNGITETLVPDDMAPELIRDSAVHFLQLNANELAIQLTFQDFAIFRQIESTEYVDDLFELKSRYGVPMLKQFAELVNREMFWVVTEVCSEHNMVRRMKIIKQFIKIARHCKECKNFNSMFAIISGLGHAAVSRLRSTWEKLPSKYQKLFCDLQDLMDPSRNMSKYRQLVLAELMEQHPIIPFYPVVKKDLTFIHLGNDTHVDQLINFEKLRMIAKEVRSLTHMCSTPYDLLTMLELKGQPPSSAMVALNQMSVSSGGTGGGAGSHMVHGLATVKRRKKSTAAPNPKKMFEEAQMVRRVKAYLNNMKVLTDEDELHVLSMECEPSGSGGGGGGSGGGSGGGGGTSGSGMGMGGGSGSGGSAPNTMMIRKRHPSPTLSTTSSTSSASEGKKGAIAAAAAAAAATAAAGPKFGTASPQAVKKILSLSEQNKTRPHQPRHPGGGGGAGGIGISAGAATGLNHHGLHHLLSHHASVSPSPSPGAHRRMGSSSSAGSVSYSAHEFPQVGGAGSGGGRVAVHERSHSDTPTPLPSVDLSAESSSVTSLSNLPLRKNMASGSVTSSDSGHGSCVLQATDMYANCSAAELSGGSGGGGGLYHVASSIVHNAPSPTTLQQRRHSTMHATSYGLMAPPPPSLPKGPRHPPAYSVAAQMARLHRLGRAHSHEGVTSASSASSLVDTFYITNEPDDEDEDDDDDAQVSAV